MQHLVGTDRFSLLGLPDPAVSGGLRSVVAAAALPAGFTHWLEGRCLQRLRPIGRTDSTTHRRQPREGAASSSSPSPIVLAQLYRCSGRLRGGCYDGA